MKNFNAIDNAIRIDKNYARAYATKAELYFYEREFDSMMINAKKSFELALVTLITVGHICICNCHFWFWL